MRGAAIHPDGTIYLPCGAGMLKIVYNPPAAPVQTLINRVGGVDLVATDAAFDANGTLWLAGGNRLCKVDLGADTAQSFPLAAAQGMATRLLIGADNQVWYLNNGTAPFGRFNPANGATTVLQSPSGAKLTGPGWADPSRPQPKSAASTARRAPAPTLTSTRRSAKSVSG